MLSNTWDHHIASASSFDWDFIIRQGPSYCVIQLMSAIKILHSSLDGITTRPSRTGLNNILFLRLLLRMIFCESLLRLKLRVTFK